MLFFVNAGREDHPAAAAWTAAGAATNMIY
jgi:hypothetical protein